LFTKDYDISFEDKASEPMPRDHMNTHTHISPIQKFAKITVQCGIYQKHKKYVTHTDFVQYKI